MECVNGSHLCYIYAHHIHGLNWEEADNLCKLKNATLPVILNRTEQIEFVNILKRFGPNIEVWTSGKQYSYGKFTWLNGQAFNRPEGAVVQRNGYTHVKVNRSLHFISSYPGFPHYSFCQFSGEKCSSDRSSLIQLASGCLNWSDYKDLPWYQARTRCLDEGGDLAVLENENLMIIRDWFKTATLGESWIGLRNSSFRWFSNGTAGFEDEIKYNNFSNITRFWFENACISVRSSDGAWSVANCRSSKKVVCLRRLVLTSSPTTTTTGHKRTTTTLSPNDNDQSDESTSGEGETQSISVSSVLMLLAICILIGTNIVFLVLYSRARKQLNDPMRRQNTDYQAFQAADREVIQETNYTELQLQQTNNSEYEEVGKQRKV